MSQNPCLGSSAGVITIIFLFQFSIDCFENYFQFQHIITISTLIVSGINIEIWKFRFPGYQIATLTVLVFGPESLSYERSRRENPAKFHEISARVFSRIQGDTVY